MTLYTHVAQNKINSALLLSGFMIFAILAGWAISYAFDIPGLLPIVVIITTIQAWVSYYYSDKIALMIARANPVTKADNSTLHNLIENLAITAGLPKPAIYIIDDSAPNAFATGRDPQHAAIAVTQGLLDKLNKPELEGVLAHELAHIGNYDIRFMSMVVILLGVITMISDFAIRSTWYRSGGNRDNKADLALMLIGIALAILSPLIATLIQLAISRKREFLADGTGALMTRYPEGLANALRKIAADTEPLEVANKGTAHLYFSNPLKTKGHKTSWAASLFMTHPPVEQRINKLLEGGGVPSA